MLVIQMNPWPIAAHDLYVFVIFLQVNFFLAIVISLDVIDDPLALDISESEVVQVDNVFEGVINESFFVCHINEDSIYVDQHVESSSSFFQNLLFPVG